jgi:hypothetical protein
MQRATKREKKEAVLVVGFSAAADKVVIVEQYNSTVYSTCRVEEVVEA